jgi:hypothetical protein
MAGTWWVASEPLEFDLLWDQWEYWPVDSSETYCAGPGLRYEAHELGYSHLAKGLEEHKGGTVLSKIAGRCLHGKLLVER